MLKFNPANKVKAFLLRIPEKHSQQIARKITQLRSNPFPHDSKKIIATDYFRADCGEYRIIYNVANNELLVIIIGKRNDGEIYKRLFRLE